MFAVSNDVILRILSALVAVSIPSIIIGRTAIGIELTLALLCLCFISDLSQWRERTLRALWVPSAFLVVATMIFWLPGLFASSDVMKSFQTWLRVCFFIFASVTLWSALCEDSRLIDYAARVLLVATVLLVSIGLIGFSGFPEVVGFLRGNGWANYDVLRHLKESASSATLLIPLIVWSGYRLRGLWSLFAGIAVLGLLALIWLTDSRSAVAGLLAIVCVTTIVIIFRARSRLIRIMLIIAITTCVAGVMWWLFDTRGDYSTHTMAGKFWTPPWLIDPARQAIWKYAWNAGEANRWFGVGINVMDRLPGARDWNPDVGVRNIPLHAHDWAFEIIVETGLVGFIALLVTITSFIYKFFQSYFKSPDPAILTVLCVWSAYWVSGLFNFSFWSSWWQISFLISTAICLSGKSPGIPSAGVGHIVVK